MRRFTGKFSKVWMRPLGQRTVARTGPSPFPSPKKSSLVCCDRNPEPAWRYFVWRSVPASTVTAAPIASRLLFCPRRRKAMEWPMSFIALRRTRSCGALRFLRITSSRPSWSRSARTKDAAVVGKVHSNRAGDFRKRAIAVVGVENVSLRAGPGRIRADQFVDRVPSLLVPGRRVRVLRRISHHLPPEEARKVARVGPGNIAIGDVQVREAIVIEIPCVGRPGPAAHLGSRLVAHVLKLAVALIAIERIATGVSAVKGADVFGIASGEKSLVLTPAGRPRTTYWPRKCPGSRRCQSRTSRRSCRRPRLRRPLQSRPPRKSRRRCCDKDCCVRSHWPRKGRVTRRN